MVESSWRSIMGGTADQAPDILDSSIASELYIFFLDFRFFFGYAVYGVTMNAGGGK